jgi:hypothetical protein
MIFQVVAANTNVGKTVFSAALCRGFMFNGSGSGTGSGSVSGLSQGWMKEGLSRRNPSGAVSSSTTRSRTRGVEYIKPAQTGFPTDSDERQV